MVILDDPCLDCEGLGTLSYLLTVWEEGALEAEKSRCWLMG